MTFVPQALAVGAVYAAYFATSVAALVTLVTAPSAQWSVDFAAYTVFTTSGLHFLLTALGYLLTDGYEPHPVEPLWAFLFADYVQAGALGATLGCYTIEPSNRVAPVVGTVVTMSAQLLCFYKTYRLVTDVWSGRRDRYTGRPNSV